MSTSWQKMARKLLLNEHGREALKQFGIDVQLATTEDKLKEKPIVVILCPTYRSPEPRMQDALAAMVKYTRDNEIATVYGAPPVQASVVHWVRNWLITEHLKTGKPWTHVLFIDDDIVIEPNAVEKLLSHKKDIVAGLCTRRNDPPVPNMRFFDQFGVVRQCWEWPENALIEVDAVGTGLMLISMHALEQVAQVYFDCLWEQEFYGLSGDKLEALKKVRADKFKEEKTCSWFRFLPTPKGDIEMGEDVTFCQLAKKYARLPVYVDTSVQPGHLGSYPYSVRDFLPYRDQMILQAKVTGDYPMEVPEMKISILVPTRGRPQNVIRLLASIQQTASIQPEVVFYVDDDDATFPGALAYSNAKVIRGPRIVMSEMWNKCLEASSGEILMMGGDDLIFKTKDWDSEVRRCFAAFPDRLVFVHGDDGLHHDNFGTHGFLHRKWIETVGYLCPPYFASDYNDTWWNDIANALHRRIYRPFVTEHMHPLAGKADWDQTHKERLERQKEQNSAKLYEELKNERVADFEKLAEAIYRHGKSMPARQPELALIQSA